jgi:hypothetical protein
MRVTLPYYADLGPDRAVAGRTIGSAATWDALRTNTEGPFALATDRHDLDRAAIATTGLQARAVAVAEFIVSRKSRRLVSYGVGGGSFETLLLKELPGCELSMTDFAPKTVQRLRELFPECTVVDHDLLTDQPCAADLHVMHRIDTEFSDSEWEMVFAKFAGERIIFVPSMVIGMRFALLMTASALRRRKRVSRSGWVRSRSSFDHLWKNSHSAHEFDAAGTPSWVLEPRR